MKKFFINTIYINLFLTLLLTGIICKILFYNCTCCNNYKENMSNILSKSTPIYNNLTKTLLGSSNFSNNNYFLQTDNDIYNNLYYDQLNNQELTKQNLNYFNNNKFSANCCSKTYEYSSSNGCICLTQEQDNFLKFRGNNNTFIN